MELYLEYREVISFGCTPREGSRVKINSLEIFRIIEVQGCVFCAGQEELSAILVDSHVGERYFFLVLSALERFTNMVSACTNLKIDMAGANVS